MAVIKLITRAYAKMIGVVFKICLPIGLAAIAAHVVFILRNQAGKSVVHTIVSMIVITLVCTMIGTGFVIGPQSELGTNFGEFYMSGPAGGTIYTMPIPVGGGGGGGGGQTLTTTTIDTSQAKSKSVLTDPNQSVVNTADRDGYSNQPTPFTQKQMQFQQVTYADGHTELQTMPVLPTDRSAGDNSDLAQQ